MAEQPAPTPDTVRAARDHLASRFARGLDELLWSETKHPLADLAAIREVLEAGARGESLAAADLAAVLMVMQTVRLDADRLEFDLLELARCSGMNWPQLAAILDLPGPEAAEAWHAHLAERRVAPVADVPPPHLQASDERAAQARLRAEQAGRRARQAAERQAQLAARHQRSSSPAEAAEAERQADTSRDHAETAHRQALLGLIRAADAHERAARALEEVASCADPREAALYRDRAADHRRRAIAARHQARHETES